jgi:hypothetical protein
MPYFKLASRAFNVPEVGRVGFLFHCHGFIHHPTLSENEVFKFIRDHFLGPFRVAKSAPVPLSLNGYGQEIGGLQGWGEYASMEKTELCFPNTDPSQDNVAIFQAMEKIRLQWSRQSRRFSFNFKKIDAQVTRIEGNTERQKFEGGFLNDKNIQTDDREFSSSEPRETADTSAQSLWKTLSTRYLFYIFNYRKLQTSVIGIKNWGSTHLPKAYLAAKRTFWLPP